MESESSPIDCQSSKLSKDTNNETNENYPDADKAGFTTKEIYYYRSIDKFYKQLPSKDIKFMMSVIDGESDISLRLLDWLVTKHSDKNAITVKQSQDENDKINVRISYKAQLKSYGKRYFDPCKRYKKFFYVFVIDGVKKKYLTTIGQLNFFKWSFEHNVITYVRDNYEDLFSEMLSSNKQDKDLREKLETGSKQSKQSKQSKLSKSDKTSKIDKVDKIEKVEKQIQVSHPIKQVDEHIIIKKKNTTITAKRIRSSNINEKKIVISFE